MALAIAIGKIVISVLSAYAVAFFRFPFRMVAFWIIFITLMLPVEVRIIPTYSVMSDFEPDQHLPRADGAADRVAPPPRCCSARPSSPFRTN